MPMVIGSSTLEEWIIQSQIALREMRRGLLDYITERPIRKLVNFISVLSVESGQGLPINCHNMKV